ncbi:MAG: glycoside hydrolase family 15 protein [Actinomycetota bacterium]|nr:glycoside hydrolase family 15 protein [Actinomycetota bacterium]
MSQRIEDYAVIGDLHTMALEGRDGSIDWLCLPHFDSAACFAKLLGGAENGFWKIAPAGAPDSVVATRRRYRGDTLVLETEMETRDGTIRVVDCMPIREQRPQLVRVVECVAGTVPVRMDLALRFDYGQSIPWVTRQDRLLTATSGPNAVSLWTRAQTRGEGMTTVSDFTLHEGQQMTFSLTWYPSHEAPPRPTDANYAVALTEAWWRTWSASCCFEGPYRDAVLRSLITLKALTYEPTGGIVAAATTSLPEAVGGERNWDYRYCWLRDATLTLESLMRGGYDSEAMAWRDWLLRATAGDVSKIQIMYGVGGERRLDEWEVDWLSGYEGSRPVRIGNAAAGQYQLDVYGEVMSALYTAARIDGVHSRAIWDLQTKLVEFLEKGWREPDDGLWEVRGPRRHFTHSKVMAWVAVDRAVRTMEDWPDLEGPVERWRALREEIRREIYEKGFDEKKNAFTQYYGSDALDASLLMIPRAGFLPATDPRMVGTVEAIERELVEDGFVLRYRTTDQGTVDGLRGREGAFLACSFWLADCLYLMGRKDDATAMFERLLSLRNDLGLLSEEYDHISGRQVGNFPQAFSHVSLVNTAFLVGGQEPTQVGLQTTGARRTSASRTDRSRGSARWAIDVLRRGVSGGARLAARGGHPLSSAHHDEVGPPGPPADPLAGDGATAGTQQSTAGKRQSTAGKRQSTAGKRQSTARERGKST